MPEELPTTPPTADAAPSPSPGTSGEGTGEAIVEAHVTPPPPRLRRRINWPTFLRSVAVRAYAAGILLVVGWAGYTAFTYLLRTVFVPTPVPERFVKWQGAIDPASLREPPPDPKDAPVRAPLSHYHRATNLRHDNATNGCTAAACHDVLPHKDASKVPAFANFHTTFLACGMCHEAGGASSATWVDTKTNRPIDAPAVLRLIAYVNDPAEDPKVAHGKLVALLREALPATGDDEILNHLRLQLETSEPASPVWKRAVDRLKVEAPAHARGDYAAKLVHDPAGYDKTTELLRNLTPKYLNSSPDSQERKDLHAKTHATLLKEPAACTTCHGGPANTLDYARLGYPAARADKLRLLQLANLMQQIRQGERFYIPKLLGSGDAK